MFDEDFTSGKVINCMDKAFEKEILEVMDIFVSANKDVDTFYHYTTIDALIMSLTDF